jgi:quinol monooxygenase YgiN
MPKPGNIVRLTTTPRGADQFAAILERALEHVQGEDGTTTWFSCRAEDDPTLFFIVDLFTDGEARNAHFGGLAAQLILGEGGPLLAGPPEVSALQMLNGKNV